jgi:hypothetical protein
MGREPTGGKRGRPQDPRLKWVKAREPKTCRACKGTGEAPRLPTQVRCVCPECFGSGLERLFNGLGA